MRGTTRVPSHTLGAGWAGVSPAITLSLSLHTLRGESNPELIPSIYRKESRHVGEADLPMRGNHPGSLSHFLLSRSGIHVGHPDLVAPVLLGGVQRLVRALHQRSEQRRLRGRGDADADGQLQAAGECGCRDPGANALGQGSGARLGRLVEDDAELFAAVACADVRFPRT